MKFVTKSLIAVMELSAAPDQAAGRGDVAAWLNNNKRGIATGALSIGLYQFSDWFVASQNKGFKFLQGAGAVGASICAVDAVSGYCNKQESGYTLGGDDSSLKSMLNKGYAWAKENKIAAGAIGLGSIGGLYLIKKLMVG